MTVYLGSFSLPIEKEEELIRERSAQNGGCLPYIDNIYPCCIFDKKRLYELRFSPITILYGGNGSGKSTLLNLIAEKLSLSRMAPFNSGELFGMYAAACSFAPGYDDEGNKLAIPGGSRIITSDDVFDYMLAVRTNNDEIRDGIEEGKKKYAKIKFGDNVRLSGIEDYEDLRLQVLSRSGSVSRRKFLRREVGEETRLCSNGETALKYFRSKLEPDTLYCLDEPENSMAPEMQLTLTVLIEELARFCSCQFIIASHSPFLLAMKGARIYDLDASPAAERNWWELDSMRAYYEFFNKNRRFFEG